MIDYRDAQFEKVLQEKVDVVFDLIGGDTLRSFVVLKEGGHLVSAVQPVSQEEAAKHRVSGVMMRLASSGEILGRIGRMVDEEKIRRMSPRCTHFRMRLRPGGTYPGACQEFMPSRPAGPK